MSYCPYLDWQQRLLFSDSIVCKLTNDYVPDKYFKDYCQNYSYCGSCPNYKEHGPKSDGCFITTVTCKILNKNDDCEVMNNLRKLREDYLKKNKQYENLLKEYDTIGPVLSDRLLNDEKRMDLANTIYDYILSSVSKSIEKEEYELAINRYFLMTLKLVKYYELEDFYYNMRNNDYDYKYFDLNNSGHGIKRELKKEYQ